MIDHVQLEARHVDLDIAGQIGAVRRAARDVQAHLRDLTLHRRVQGSQGSCADDTVGDQAVARLEPAHGLTPARRPSLVGQAGSPAGRPTAPDAAAARPARAGSCAPAGAGPRRPRGWPARRAARSAAARAGCRPAASHPGPGRFRAGAAPVPAGSPAAAGRSTASPRAPPMPGWCRCRCVARDRRSRRAVASISTADIAGLARRADLESGARCRGWVAAGLGAQECQQRLAALFGGHAAGPQRREAARGVDRVQGRVAVAAGRDGQLVRGSCAGRADDAPDKQEGS